MTQIIKIRVTPNAKHEKITEIPVLDENANERHFRVYVTVVPEDGKANKAVLKLLSKTLGLPKSSLVIIKGETARDKVIEVK